MKRSSWKKGNGIGSFIEHPKQTLKEVRTQQWLYISIYTRSSNGIAINKKNIHTHPIVANFILLLSR